MNEGSFYRVKSNVSISMDVPGTKQSEYLYPFDSVMYLGADIHGERETMYFYSKRLGKVSYSAPIAHNPVRGTGMFEGGGSFDEANG